MKRLKNFLLFVLVSIACNAGLRAQDLHVYYNMFNDSVAYVKDGKTLEKQRLRRGGEVRLHVTEFNNFLYDIEMKVEESAAQTGGGLLQFAGMNGFLPGFAGMAGTPFGAESASDQGGTTSLFDLPLLTLNDNPITLKSLFKGSRGSEQALDMAHQTMKDITQIAEDVKLIQKDLMASERALKVARLAIANVDRVKTHPNIKPSQIKKMCLEYYEGVFRNSPGDVISLEDILNWQDLPAENSQQVKRLKAKQSELAGKISTLQSLSEQLTALGFDDKDYVKFTRDMVVFQKQSREFNEQLKSATAGGNQAGIPTVQEITDLQLKLAEVISNDFTYSSYIQTTNDIVNVTIKLYRKDDPKEGEERKLVKEKTMRLEARGGLKLNPSVGVSFGQFFSPGKSYEVKNDVIVAEDEDTFVPYVTSFLHFYSYTGKQTTLGGSFGIGFPILSSDADQSINFFLGPSLIFGSSQRFILSGGLMGGKVRKLAKGFKVGDDFNNDNGDIPTRKKYELGLYLGASFSFGN